MFDFMNAPVSVGTLAKQELFGSKIKALLERTAPRDLYDISNMIDKKVIGEDDRDLLRKCVLFYRTVGSTGEFKKDITLDEIDKLTFTKVRQTLLPVLRKSEYVDLAGMQDKVKTYLSELLVFTGKEQQYIDNFMSGTYSPELLFDDADIVKRVETHPMALWKVAQYREEQER